MSANPIERTSLIAKASLAGRRMSGQRLNPASRERPAFLYVGDANDKLSRPAYASQHHSYISVVELRRVNAFRNHYRVVIDVNRERFIQQNRAPHYLRQSPIKSV